MADKTAWSSLNEGGRAYQRRQGITPQVYNAWFRQPQESRRSVSRLAREAGYDSGLQFYAARSQVRAHGKIKTREYVQPSELTPREAARRLMRGSRGAVGKGNRRRIAQLFPQTEDFTGPEWEEFMSELHFAA